MAEASSSKGGNAKPINKPTGRPGSPRASEIDLNDPHLQLQHSPSFEHMKHGLSISDTSKHNISRKASSQSDRIRRLLSLLEDYDSLYLCPVKSVPKTIMDEIGRRKPVRMYEVKDYYGVTSFYAVELTNHCCYLLCSNSRPFQIYMYTPEGQLIFESERNNGFALCLCGVDCCIAGGIYTSANFRNDEHYIGGVVSGCSCSGPVYTIQNKFWDDKFHLKGPKLSLWMPARLCCIKEFIIYKPSTQVPVGKIIKGYDGLEEDRITNKETVGVIFPPRCTPEIKACLIAAGFMLDITYFHNRGFTFHRIFRYLSYVLMVAGFAGLIVFLVIYQHLN